MSMLDLLGSDIMGEYNAGRSDITRAELSGNSSCIDNRKCATSMYIEGRFTLTLDDQDEQTSEKNSGSKRKLLDQSDNPYWRGYSERRNKQVSKLYQRKRQAFDIERSSV